MRQKQRVFSLFLLSPSSRRAWIEMCIRSIAAPKSVVALLAEGVDRNLIGWREIRTRKGVALLAEGVDRNSLPLVPGIMHAKVALLAEGVDRNILLDRSR